MKKFIGAIVLCVLLFGCSGGRPHPLNFDAAYHYEHTSCRKVPPKPLPKKIKSIQLYGSYSLCASNTYQCPTLNNTQHPVSSRSIIFKRSVPPQWDVAACQVDSKGRFRAIVGDSSSDEFRCGDWTNPPAKPNTSPGTNSQAVIPTQGGTANVGCSSSGVTKYANG